MKLAAGMATALTRALLLLYPASFRREVREAMLGDVERRAQELTGSRRGLGTVVWLVRLGASLLANAFAAWGEEMRGRRRRSQWTILTILTFFSWVDLKLALRMLAKYPGLTLTGGLGIAVAIAIGVAFFSFGQWRFNPVIPLSEGDRLVGLENWDLRTTREERRSLHDFVLWRAEMESVEDMTAFQTVARNVIAEDGSVKLVLVADMTPSGFRLARVPPLLGRTLVESDAAPGAAPVIVIGFDVWRARFLSDPAVVGKDLRLGSTLHTIVGVMPEGFAFPINHRFWTPLKVDPLEHPRGQGPSLYISGRLAPGFDLAAARAELSVIGKRMAAEFPDTHGHLSPDVLPYIYPFAGMNRSSAESVMPMNILFGVLLVVVCANVAILVYARTATRLGEIAVRTALGASRGRIVAQLFAESLVLSVAAAAVGVVIVKVGFDQLTRWQLSLEEATPEFWIDYRLSGSAFIYAVTLTVLAAVITGVIPALQATGRRVQSNLSQFHSGSGLRLGRTWTTLIVVQVSLAAAALPIAVATAWFVVRDVFSVPTFPVEQILYAQVGGGRGPSSAKDVAAHLANLRAELSRKLAAEPGHVGHSFTLDLPIEPRTGRVAIEHGAAASAAGVHPEVQRATVDLDFFRTFDVGVLAGRPFQSGDRGDHSADVVIVNRAFARRVLGDDALGRRIRFLPENRRDPSEGGTERWYEIVGIVENTERNPFNANLIEPRVYHPLKEGEASGALLLLRFKGIDQPALSARIQHIAAAVDPTLTLDVVPFEKFYRFLRMLRTIGAIGIGVALLSVLLLSAAGIYALMSFTVARRRREIAIRTALGARPGRLLGGIFGQALRQVSLGVAVGVGVALFVDAGADGEALRGNGGVLLSVMVVVMSLLGLFAAVGPARRGLRIEPAEVLKGE